MDEGTVFYSWQSDAEASLNRDLIDGALTAALDVLSKSHGAHLTLDRATDREAGSPDIAEALFRKIDTCALFVADISLVGAVRSKRTPNPNVLVEVGYAAARLGWSRIICVANTDLGPLEQMPFDLRQRRTLTYRASSSLTKRLQKRQDRLAEALSTALKAVIENESRRFGRARYDVFDVVDVCHEWMREHWRLKEQHQHAYSFPLQEALPGLRARLVKAMRWVPPGETMAALQPCVVERVRALGGSLHEVLVRHTTTMPTDLRNATLYTMMTAREEARKLSLLDCRNSSPQALDSVWNGAIDTVVLTVESLLLDAQRSGSLL